MAPHTGRSSYVAGSSTAPDWRRTRAGPNIEPAQVWRRTLRNRGAVHGPPRIWSQTKYGAGLSVIVAPYMVRPQYGAGPSTAPVPTALCPVEHILHQKRGAVHGADPIWSRTKYGAGLSEIVAPYMGRPLYPELHWGSESSNGTLGTLRGLPLLRDLMGAYISTLGRELI